MITHIEATPLFNRGKKKKGTITVTIEGYINWIRLGVGWRTIKWLAWGHWGSGFKGKGEAVFHSPIKFSNISREFQITFMPKFISPTLVLWIGCHEHQLPTCHRTQHFVLDLSSEVEGLQLLMAQISWDKRVIDKVDWWSVPHCSFPQRKISWL